MAAKHYTQVSFSQNHGKEKKISTKVRKLLKLIEETDKK